MTDDGRRRRADQHHTRHHTFTVSSRDFMQAEFVRVRHSRQRQARWLSDDAYGRAGEVMAKR